MGRPALTGSSLPKEARTFPAKNGGGLISGPRSKIFSNCRWSTTTTPMPPLSTPISASSAKIRCGTRRCRQSSVPASAAALSTTVASFAALAAWQVSWVIFEFLWKICCRTINRSRNATVVFTAIWKAFAANFTDPDAYFVGGGIVEAEPHFRDWCMDIIRASTELRDEQRQIVRFAVVPDLDMAGARGSALAGLQMLRIAAA